MTLESPLPSDRRANFIDGEWRPPSTRRYDVVEDPFRELPIGLAPSSTPDDVADAVAAAHRAAASWASTPPEVRADHLERITAGLEARLEQFARCWTQEVGIPISMARAATAGLPITALRSAATLARTMPWDERIGNSSVLRRPVGVVGVITPWNYPLSQIATKTAAALAAGCTVVAKPSEIAPLCAFGFADVVAEAGLPAGVFNIVGGDGARAGAALASDRRLGAVSFTGSTTTGSAVMRAAAGNITRVCLELGGKSASIVLDADVLERAIAATAASCLRNSGQTCTSLTRLIVPRSIAAEAIALATEHFRAAVLGDPLDDTTTLGPLVSATQRARVRAYIAEGVRSGATLVVGGEEPPHGFPTGYFVEPTVFCDVDPRSPIAQEEIFGPVLSIVTVDDETEALRAANDNEYGLAGAVWASDDERALALAMELEAGSVTVNGGAFNPDAPYGGIKRSGIGSELGRFGIEEFQVSRVLNLP